LRLDNTAVKPAVSMKGEKRSEKIERGKLFWLKQIN